MLAVRRHTEVSRPGERRGDVLPRPGAYGGDSRRFDASGARGISSCLMPVSIITASYNYARLLPEALDSVLAQTHERWELLAVDDGSSDGSWEVLRAYAARDGRIRVLRHADGGNHGLSATLRAGLAQARFPLVAFLEADDAWAAGSLARRVEALVRTGADVCWSGVRMLAEDGLDIGLTEDFFRVAGEYFSRLRSPFSMTAGLHGRCLLPTFSAVLLRRSALERCDFSPPEGAWLDWWLWQQLALRASFVFVPEALTMWRIHRGSYTRALDAGTASERRERFLAAARAMLLPEARRRGRAEWVCALLFPRTADFLSRAALLWAADGSAGVLRALRRRMRNALSG